MKRIVIAVLFLAAAVVAAVAYGSRRWDAETTALLDRLEAPAAMAHYRENDLQGLPPPVQRYFRNVLKPGQPQVHKVHHVQEGDFRMRRPGAPWRKLIATQTHSANVPGFVWDARIEMAPFVDVRVRDTYINARASMQGRVLGLIPVLDVQREAELNSGALQRYLAEAIWFPTSLLPGQGVEWSYISDTEARATLKDGPTKVSLNFRFNAEGEITGSHTGARYAEMGGHFELRPWQSRCWDYAERGGMRIPLAAEVAWREGAGAVPYWRARISQIRYQAGK